MHVAHVTLVLVVISCFHGFGQNPTNSSYLKLISSHINLFYKKSVFLVLLKRIPQTPKIIIKPKKWFILHPHFEGYKNELIILK